MNPIILYDNRFLDGALTATDTASGFHVDNIKDRNADTFWKAASYGAKYITEAPLAKDTLAQEEMRISPADGYAGVYLPASLDLTPYLGDRIVCLDSALKKHIGYIKSIESDKYVNLTESTSVGGITVSDNDNIDMPTNNFTMVWKGAFLDWTPSSNSYIFLKYTTTGGWTGFMVSLTTAGKIRVALGSAGVFALDSTTSGSLGCENGTRHRIVVVVTRETATAAGSAKIYKDGTLFETLAISAAATASLANSGDLKINGDASKRYAAVTAGQVIIYNRALTDDQVLALEGGTIAAEDQYGSQTSLVTGDNSTFASDTGWWSKSTGVSISGGACHFVNVANDAGLFRNAQLVEAGKWVKVTYTIANITEGGIRVAIYGPAYGPTHTANGIYTDYILASAGSLGKVYIVAVGETSCDIDDVTITQAGACLDLNESGIEEIASLNSATLINSPALPYTTFSGASATGFHAESDGSGPHVAGTTDAIPFVAGRKYRVQFTLTLNSGAAPYYGAAVSLAGAVIGGASASNLAVEGLNTYEFTCTGSDTGVIEFWNNSEAANYDISDLSVIYFGCKDNSTNGLDAAFPASGCAVVRFNNVVSTPGGSTYNWESKEAGYNHEDAGGYAYKISESDACDALFLFGHNLGTAEASVSVESTDDEVNWTERLAVFSPTDDHALMKLLTSFRAASKRLKMVTTTTAPHIAVAMLGVRMEFPFPPDSPYDPYNIGIESESEVSVEGNHLGDVIYYHPIAQRAVFSNPLRSFITDTYKPFWDAHGKLRKPFAWAWDLTNYPDVVYFMKLSKNARLSMPLSVGTYADALVVDMEGVAEP